MATKRRGVSRKGWASLSKEIKRQFGDMPQYAAQFGVRSRRDPYKYKRPPKGPKPAKWDNLQILVNGLMNQRRNPIFTTPEEEKKILAFWLKASSRYLKTKRRAVLAAGARRVSKELIRVYQDHMTRGITKPGRAGKLPKAAVTARRIKRASDGNVNYIRNPRVDRARRSGYGVDTGHLFEAMYIGVKKQR